MGMYQRRFFLGVADNGHGKETIMGLCYPFSREGDKIAVIYGCRWPILLSECRETPGTYTVVGEVYVNGFMHGEAMDRFEETEFKLY